MYYLVALHDFLSFDSNTYLEKKKMLKEKSCAKRKVL